MKRLNHLYRIFFVVGILFLMPAKAFSNVTHFVNNNGQLVSVEGVDVDGTLYDVQFLDGTFGNVYSGITIPVIHNDETKAQSFAEALANQVFLDNVSINGNIFQFDTSPELTFGCEFTNLCRILVPYLYVDSPAKTIGVWNYDNDPLIELDEVRGIGINPSTDSSTITTVVYARFAQAGVSTVPEPSTYTMLLFGVLALAGFKVHRKGFLAT